MNDDNKASNDKSTLDYKIQVMNGTGNSFAITSYISAELTNEFHKLFSTSNNREFAKKICKLLNVDGFIILTEADKKTNDYKWLFFNKDGSDAEMCGNAARCVGHFTFKNHVAGNEQQFESLAGVIEVIVENESSVTVKMPTITAPKMNLTYEFGGSSILYDYLDTGVPHSVIQLEHFNKHTEFKSMAEKLRHSQSNHKDGSNVTFYSPISNDTINSVSFERGVEDFTDACGTGAVAAAFSHSKKTNEKIINIDMPGGSVKVDFSNDKPYLIGPIEYGKAYFPEDLKELWMNSYTD